MPAEDQIDDESQNDVDGEHVEPAGLLRDEGLGTGEDLAHSLSVEERERHEEGNETRCPPKDCMVNLYAKPGTGAVTHGMLSVLVNAWLGRMIHAEVNHPFVNNVG